MRAYLDLMREALDNGAVKSDRTGTGVRSLFGRQLRFDLAQGFPLVTTKRLHIKSIVRELIWFLQGRHQCRLSEGPRRFHLGRMGRRRRRSRSGLRQAMARLGRAGRADVRSDRLGHRRDPPQPGLAPPRRLGLERRRNRAHEARRPAIACSSFMSSGGRLSCQLYQRSADIFLGVPFNIASYALLDPSDRPRMRARGGRVRAYVRRRASLPQSRGAGARAARARAAPAAALKLGDVGSIFDLNADAIAFEGYDPWPAIKAKVAV